MIAIPSWPVIVEPRGRFANLMFQYMLAEQIRRRLGERARVHGPGLPEWGWPADPVPTAPVRPLVLRGHAFDLDEVAYLLRSGVHDALLIQGWGMRVEYFPDRAAVARLFTSDAVPAPVDDDEVLVHVRAEDIESGRFRGYYPLPFAFHDAVIAAEGRRPVFMGQLQPGPYADALRARFPSARFLPAGTPLADFQTLRSARCVALSVSSFAWLAAWLSDVAQTIHYPVAGIFDPRRGVQNLAPVGDPRYRFWEVEFPTMAQRAGIPSAAEWAGGPRSVRPMDTPDRLRRLGSAARTVRVPAFLVAGRAPASRRG